MTGWWFGFVFFHISGMIMPIDELIFFRGFETTNQMMLVIYLCCGDWGWLTAGLGWDVKFNMVSGPEDDITMLCKTVYHVVMRVQNSNIKHN